METMVDFRSKLKMMVTKTLFSINVRYWSSMLNHIVYLVSLLSNSKAYMCIATVTATTTSIITDIIQHQIRSIIYTVDCMCLGADILNHKIPASVATSIHYALLLFIIYLASKIICQSLMRSIELKTKCFNFHVMAAIQCRNSLFFQSATTADVSQSFNFHRWLAMWKSMNMSSMFCKKEEWKKSSQNFSVIEMWNFHLNGFLVFDYVHCAFFVSTSNWGERWCGFSTLDYLR